MSADNYGIVHRHGDGYGLSMGFSSYDGPDDLTKPYFTAKTLEEVEEFAANEYFEYGWSTTDEVRQEKLRSRRNKVLDEVIAEINERNGNVAFRDVGLVLTNVITLIEEMKERPVSD